jgi:pyrimidine-nucleoside phosphorylase
LSPSALAFHELVERKNKGQELTRDQIEEIVKGFCANRITDAQMTVWLQAVVRTGLSPDETTWLTKAMASSGQQIHWSHVGGVVVDKHSTGGVGDEVSIIAVPAAAACGAKVAKLSGRGLGHTGGTIDKLECIPGLQTDLTIERLKRQVGDVGCAIAQASDELAPADKKMYALRHRTQTVASIGLIAASVLSKKIAGGAPHLVIDVKCGRCAFLKTKAEALDLGNAIVHVARSLGRYISVLVTDMDSPLADSIGDILELDEALAVLDGHEGSRLSEVALVIASEMLAIRDPDNPDAARYRSAVQHGLRSGTAKATFAAMVSAQGGKLASFEPPGEPALTVVSHSDGFVSDIDGLTLSEAVTASKITAPRGSTVGVRLRKREGAQVKKGEPLVDVFGNSAHALAVLAEQSVKIAQTPPAPRPLIIERMYGAPL